MKTNKVQSMKIDSDGTEWYLVKKAEWPNGQVRECVYVDRCSRIHLKERFNEDGLMIASGIV